MNVFIVEDNLFHLEDLLITVEKLGHICVGTTSDPFEALEQIAKVLPDVVLLDIHLQGKHSGIVLGKRICTIYKLPIVFTTSYISEKIISEAVDISPIAYLIKPIDTNELRAALMMAQKKIVDSTNLAIDPLSSIFIKSGTKLIKVIMNTILFIHTDSKNYCSLITTDNKKLTVRYSIQGIYKLLDKSVFVQTHRSYIINWKKIDTLYESDQMLEIQKHRIPIGRTYKKHIYMKLNII